MSDTHDIDASKYVSGEFVKRLDVEDADRTFTITGVTEEQFDARNGRPAEAQLVLALAGDPPRKFSLRNRVNKLTLITTLGKRTSGWIGRQIVIYLDRTVPNPSGGAPGGLRIRIPQRAPVAPPTPAAPLLTRDQRRAQLEAELASLAPREPGDDDVEIALATVPF